MNKLISKTCQSIAILALLAFSNTVVAQDSNVPDTLLSPAQWIDFQTNVSEAIHSDNAGVREGALRMVIRYGQFLNLDRDDIFAIMRIYRDYKEVPTRRMAIRALGGTQDRWAIEFLDMLAPFEENAVLKSTIQNTVRAYWESHGGNPYN